MDKGMDGGNLDVPSSLWVAEVLLWTLVVVKSGNVMLRGYV